MSVLSRPASLRPIIERPLFSAPAQRLEAAWSRFAWQAAPDEAPLAGRFAEADAWSTLLRTADVSVVKAGPHRTVFRLVHSTGEFYLKHFHPLDFRNWLKHLFRPTRAEHELDLAVRLRTAGVDTFRPIAVGVAFHGGSPCESVLVSHAVPAAIPLDEFLERSRTLSAPRATLVRQRLAWALGELLGRLHSVGGDHRDLHAGNVLCRLTDDDSVQLTLIDLQSLVQRQAMSDQLRNANLANFHQALVGLSTRTDRLRFWHRYFAFAPPLTKTTVWPIALERLAQSLGWPPIEGSVGLPQEHINRERDWQTELERQLCRQALRGWQRADRAWSRGNRHVRILAERGRSVRGLATLPREFLQGLLAAPEQLFAADGLVRFCKQTPRCRVALVRLPVPDGAITACVKSNIATQPRRRWLAPLRWSPARRAWEIGHALLRRGIETPRPLLCLEQSSGGNPRGYLATAWLPGTVSAQAFVTQELPRLAAELARATLAARARRLAWMLRRMHACGFDHRDLKLANLLVDEAPLSSRVWLLDLEGVRRWKVLPRQRAAQNLARLEVSCRAQGVASKSMRLRFLKWYLAGSGEDWRVWWNLVERIGDQKEVQSCRRGRPIS